jgi:hypothetical protein
MMARVWRISRLRSSGILRASVLFFASLLFSSQLALGQSLQITPSTNIVASGPQGGVFSPSVFQYKLSAVRGIARYSITNVPKWLTASSTSGWATSRGTTVSFSINSGAKNLTPNTYVGSINVGSSNLGITSIINNALITATLTIAAPPPPPPAPILLYTIAVSVSPSAGGIAVGGGTFKAGSSQTVTATASSGYSFVNWTQGGSVVSTSASYTFTLNSNVALVANFALVSAMQYTIAVGASPSADGTVSGGGTFAAGASDTVTATANSGYSFVNWTANGSVVSTSASYAFTVTRNVTLVANFGGVGNDPTVGALPSYNDDYANWQKAGLISVGGIPTRTTQCGSTVSPTGLTPPQAGDDVTVINSAISACPAGEVVQLSAGTFQISQSEAILIGKGITLRGTGNCSGTTTISGGAVKPYCQTVITVPDGLTHVNNTETCAGGSCSGVPVIMMTAAGVAAAGATGGAMWNWSWSGCSRSTWYVDGTCTGTIVPLNADAAQGQTTVQVGSTSPFSVGQWVMITEASGAQWITDPVTARGGQLWAAPDVASTSGGPVTTRVVWAKYNPYPGYGDFSAGNFPFQANTLGCGGWGMCDRVTSEIHLVESIGAGPCPGVNCTVTFDSPLTTAFRVSGGAQFTGYISGTTLTVTAVSSGTVLVDEPITDQTAIISGSGATTAGGTYITALGTGSGGVGTYTVSTSQTLCSSSSPCALAAGGYAAKILFPTTSNSGATIAFTEYAGLENLSVNRGNGGDILILFCAYCWVRNVDASEMAKGAVEMQSAVRTQVDTLFGHDCWANTNAGGEYPIDFEWGSTEDYVVNSITRACGKGMTARGGGAGSVVAYNYVDDQYYGEGSGLDFWVIDASTNGSHFSGAHHILFEGNWGVNLLDDHVHGNDTYHTYFRNFVAGYRTPFTDPQSGESVNDYTNTITPNDGFSGDIGPFRTAVPTAYAYWHAYVGNTLGLAAYAASANGWTYQSGTGAEGGQNIWDLGSDDPTGSYDSNLSGIGGNPQFIFRNGNYDTVTTSVHWDASDPAHILPSSFYLYSAPSFFGPGASCTYTWPWVTPTGSTQIQSNSCGGSGLPAKARYESGTPFVQP